MKLIKIAFLTTLMMGSGLQGMEERQQQQRQGLFNLFHRVNEIERQNPSMQFSNAANTGDVQKLKRLIEEGYDINGKDNYGSTALLKASSEGYYRGCELLLDHGANPNVSNDDGLTPIMFAANKGYKRICELLIAHKANINLQDKYGYTALLWAARDFHRDICKLLINAMVKLTDQERSEVSTLLSLKKRNIPGSHSESIKIVALTRLDDIKREKKQNAREQIMKIENEKLKAELLKHLDSIK